MKMFTLSSTGIPEFRERRQETSVFCPPSAPRFHETLETFISRPTHIIPNEIDSVTNQDL